MHVWIENYIQIKMRKKPAHTIHFLSEHFNLVLIILIAFFFEFDLYSQTPEYEVKAVAFEKLSLFIDWPPNTFNETNDQFVITVFGQSPFGNILERVYNGHKIKDKTVKIVYIKDIRDLPECQILFIPEIKKNELKDILDFINNKPILIIADKQGFAEAGCFISFYNYEDKLHFEINQKAMESAGFTIDYKLLRVSKIVNTTIE